MSADDKPVGDHLSAKDAALRIRVDMTHGASWLAREAVRALAVVASSDGDPTMSLAEVHALAREVALARPSMAAIANTVAHVWWRAEQRSTEPAKQLAALRDEALVVEAHWGQAVEQMTRWVRTVASGPIYTLSRSGSVEGALAALARERSASDLLRIFVSESRPGGEGVAMAKALALAGAQVTLAVDAASAALMAEATLVLVGADSVRADGDVVNKVGTYALALAAHAAGKPVYALAERLKITAPSYPLVIEEMATSELLSEPVAGVTLRNIYFDVTPARFITSVVTEGGPTSVSEIARLATEAERAYQSLMRQ